MSWTSSRISPTSIRPERAPFSRSIWVMSPVTTIFEPKPSRVRNIFICSGLVFWASSRITKESLRRAAAHERQRRDLDRAALEVGVDPLGVEHVVERVEQRAQVRVDLRLEVAGQEAEALAGLDRGAGEDDALDLAARERRGGHRDREEGLAGAGRADPEGDRVVADRVDVALLVDGLRRDPRVAVLPDDVLEDLGGALAACRARPVTASIVPGAISWPCSIRSTSSPTTVSAVRTSPSSPSSVSTLPRR